MSTIFIGSHGSHPVNDGETFVPAGMVVKFIADFQENAMFPNALAVISSGGLGGSREDSDSGADLSNYLLSPLDEREQLWFISAKSPHHDQLFLLGSEYQELRAGIDSIGSPGGPVPLCSDDVACREAEDGQHHCQGLFGLLRERGLGNDIELYLLNCRGTSADAPMTAALGKEEREAGDVSVPQPGYKFDPDDSRYLPTMHNKYDRLSDQWLTSDRQDVIDELDGIPEATRVILDASSKGSTAWAEKPLSVWNGDEENIVDDFPDRVKMEYTKVPSSLMAASEDIDWRHSFYLYLNSSDHADTKTRLTFNLWSQLRKALGESNPVSPYVQETIAHFAYRYPGIVEENERKAIESIGGTLGRLWSVEGHKDSHVDPRNSLEASELELVEDIGAPAAIQQTQQHFHAEVIALYTRLTEPFVELWPAFTVYIHNMWEQLTDLRAAAANMDEVD